ncbi:DUF4278 domain-containing protein [Waterburya agarophytonicola K14]|uniref:DUF4278 domain-containing protein n=1 Tax=Waterburya agarophytonicola KI4 TaxID=2874699 RepID=A0A964FIU0_9CYAN|nr:DUF4278 domain-containing protein [Waterburya agarophytonicola]MCC0178709.1 DUF4278 domain-containing protein [Waterburya agarophytonicola KI4]
MKLTYRGVEYSEENQYSLASILATANKEITYRGNSPKGRINPNFPWLGYIKQLFKKSESRPILDPITFWYNHKREFVAECWSLGDADLLDRAWDLTVHREKSQALKSKRKIQLKYRGVTYYKY